MPITIVTVVISLDQLNGRDRAGYSPGGKCLLSHAWMLSADCGAAKSNRIGCPEGEAFGPVVGGKRKRTGAVASWYCNILASERLKVYISYLDEGVSPLVEV